MMRKNTKKALPCEGKANNHKRAGLHLITSNSWTIKQAAIVLLTRNDPPLNWKAAQFLGQCAVADKPLSQSQSAWLAKLLDASGLPHIKKEA
jgi:hypothetical protein